MNVHGALIDGDWLAGPETRPNINPSDTSDVVGEFASCRADAVDAAVSAARRAFPTWAATSSARRAEILDSIAATLIASSGELGQLLAREEGKTLAEATAEVVRAGQIFRFFSGEAWRAGGEHIPSTRPGVTVEVRREPLGVVAAITPWNFPIAIPAWKVAPAIAYGNCVILKPADLAPASAWQLARMALEAGLPPGVLNLVTGPGRVLGPTLCAHEEVDAITFTGSQAVGEQVAQAAVRRLARLQLEMGGKNPLVVAADADLDVAVDVAVQGAYFSTGQRCTASSRLIVVDEVHDHFVDVMSARMRRLVVGHALEPGTDIGPVVDQAQLDIDQEYLHVAGQQGAERILGGRLTQRPTHGFYLEPALVVGTTNGQRINREEVFGPVATTIRAEDYEHALHLANETEFGLSAGICTTSLKLAEHFKANSQAGMVMVNLPTAGVDPHVPFGGRKKSSYGPREQGSYAREFFTALKTTYTSP